MATLNPARSKYYYSKTDSAYHESKYENKCYTNEDAIKNAIEYVTRTGKRKDRANELIAWGAAGVCYYYLTPQDCIVQFQAVQDYCRRYKETKSKIVHEILTFSNEEASFLLSDIGRLNCFANQCAHIYYNKGFQCVYGIHLGAHEDSCDQDKVIPCLHIHFIINSVNFRTGNLFETHIGSKAYSENNVVFFKISYDTKQREQTMNEILYKDVIQMDNPYNTSDFDSYFSNAYQLYPRAVV